MRVILAALLLVATAQAQYTPSGSRGPSVSTISNVRGTSQYGSGATTTAVVPLPVGSQAGDFAVLTCSAAWNTVAVSGWTTIILDNSSIWHMYAADKALSSGDITTGSVSVSFTGGSASVACTMTTFIGATSGVRESQSLSSTSPSMLTTTSAVLSTDVGIYWGSVANGSVTLSITPGAGSLSGAYTQNIRETGGASTSTSLLSLQTMHGGAQTNTFSSTGALSWAIQVIVAQ